MSRSPRHDVVVVRGDGGRIVCERCEVADTVLGRARGLLGRSELASGAGLLIKPSFSIHTFFMRFPIDVIFVDRAGSVVKIVPAMKPWRTALGGSGAHSVLELNAGEATAGSLEVGDVLRLPWR